MPICGGIYFIRKYFFSNKERNRLETLHLCLKTVRQRPKEHYYDQYKHKNNLCCYNCLILENSIIITEIRITECKTDEGWSYE